MRAQRRPEHERTFLSAESFGKVRWFLLASVLVALVNDGWSGRPLPAWKHQVILLPLAAALWVVLWFLLRPDRGPAAREQDRITATRWSWLTLAGFELLSLLGFWYEGRHFARFGYAARPVGWALLLVVVVGSAICLWRLRTGWASLAGVLAVYAGGVLFALRYFPLNYLRSDMLPVILWADQRIVQHLNPYGTMHVGDRLYDFPYLPGMLVAYLPAVATRLDVRWVNLACVLGVGALIVAAARATYRREAALLVGVFALSPFLQYRHELYLAPHWLTLAAAFALMARRRFAWAAVLFGASMALYQLSWVLFPFLLLFALRRGGVPAVLREGLLALAAMLAVVGPFLRAALGRIASNTVGQWSRLPHALADPINLSYWATFLVRPDQLKWVQLVVMTGIFVACVVRGRCRTLQDTLRFMGGALALFIALNVLVDGYFYLTLLLVLLVYTLVAAGMWPEPAQHDGSLAPN